MLWSGHGLPISVLRAALILCCHGRCCRFCCFLISHPRQRPPKKGSAHPTHQPSHDARMGVDRMQRVSFGVQRARVHGWLIAAPPLLLRIPVLVVENSAAHGGVGRRCRCPLPLLLVPCCPTILSNPVRRRRRSLIIPIVAHTVLVSTLMPICCCCCCFPLSNYTRPKLPTHPPPAR